VCGEPRGGRYRHGGQWVCWPCSGLKPLKPPPLPKPTAYARLHRRVWAALERSGTVFTLADGTGRLFGWCPVCGEGTVDVRVIDADPPFVRQHGCTDGCTGEQVARALA
jgi:hypothetical protein